MIYDIFLVIARTDPAWIALRIEDRSEGSMSFRERIRRNGIGGGGGRSSEERSRAFDASDVGIYIVLCR